MCSSIPFGVLATLKPYGVLDRIANGATFVSADLERGDIGEAHRYAAEAAMSTQLRDGGGLYVGQD